MRFDANEAKQRANVVGGANRLVNETAAEPLIAAADRGEMVARIAIGRIALVSAYGLMGHVYDAELADALDAAKHAALALAVRKLTALGFNVAATVREVEPDTQDDDSDPPPRAIFIDEIRLGFAAAEELEEMRLKLQVLHGVVLPPAHHWRRRANAALAAKRLEDKVLALVAQEVEAGSSRCRINARNLGEASLQGEVAERMVASLRARGFTAEVLNAGAQLNVRWDT